MASRAASKALRVALRGDLLLHNARLNKGSAFTDAERRAFKLVGRLPAQVNDLNEQCKRAYDQLENHETPLAKNAFLQSLRDQVCAQATGLEEMLMELQNWVLYYSLIGRHLTELMPIIYTPTEVRCA
jgi:malate dehydrogenase (oxaloacetate-decarboxylating)